MSEVKLVKDIFSGPGGSNPGNFTVFNNKLFFTATDGTKGRELWESDGTEAGTKLVKDIRSDPGSSKSDNFTVFNNNLAFNSDVIVDFKVGEDLIDL